MKNIIRFLKGSGKAVALIVLLLIPEIDLFSILLGAHKKTAAGTVSAPEAVSYVAAFLLVRIDM